MSKGASKRVGDTQEHHSKAPQPWDGPSPYETRLWERVSRGDVLCACGCGERAERVTKVDGQPTPAGWCCIDYDSPKTSPS